MSLDANTRAARLAALRAGMAAAGLDAVAIVPGATQRYLLGTEFGLMERPTVLLVPLAGELRMILPALEAPGWAALGIEARVHPWQDSDGFEAAFGSALADLPARAMGVEGQRMRVFEMLALRRHIANAEVIDAQLVFAALRLRKDAAEIASLRRAIAISEAALTATLAQVRVGDSERAVHGRLIAEMFAAGAEALSFPPIVVSGARAALPHASAGDDRVQAGDTLLFDFGVAVDGYSADITRTVFMGEPVAEARALYETVLAANEAGRAATLAGATAHAVDDAAQRVLETSPFAAHILHRTGHGLGLDVHEAPQLMRGNHEVLEEGAVVTIEPGLYVQGVRGVRIEDDVLVTADGSLTLTSFPRELMVIE